ncbi:MAG: helix-turn-helix transcriptional regulator [Defluviitaleaceae bacterium]|nr:helix-turn-helix transcriptional regulator [Defluviitaleaceae bacterium]
MEAKGVSTYALKHKLKIGGGTYNRLKEGLPVSTNTISMLCDYLRLLGLRGARCYVPSERRC